MTTDFHVSSMSSAVISFTGFSLADSSMLFIRPIVSIDHVLGTLYNLLLSLSSDSVLTQGDACCSSDDEDDDLQKMIITDNQGTVTKLWLILTGFKQLYLKRFIFLGKIIY